MPALIVIPTWQEAVSLPTLLEQLVLLPEEEYHFLVVDDGSPDGTGQIADRYHDLHPQQVHVLHREQKTGLRDAYFDGFRWALQHDYSAVVQMDADGSHHPQYLTDLVEPVLKGEADLMNGSRWMPEGSTSGWAWYRKLLSKTGTWYARLLLQLPYTDITGGYRCYRPSVVHHLTQPGKITASGYGFQIEMLLHAHQGGFKVKETPIVFSDRAAGVSKMTLPIMWEAFKTVIEQRFHLKRPSFCWKRSHVP